MSDCCMPRCDKPQAEGFNYPLCARHAQGIYLAVKDRLEAATLRQRIAAASTRESRPTPSLGPRRGVVYFAECGELVKIGFSTNIAQRMRDLGGTLLHSFPGTMQDEKAMLARFGPHWERGEYFRREGALADYLAELDGL